MLNQPSWEQMAMHEDTKMMTNQLYSMIADRIRLPILYILNHLISFTNPSKIFLFSRRNLPGSHIETHFRWQTRTIFQHLHSEISQSSASSANPYNHPTIHQETRLLQTPRQSADLEESRSLLAEAEKAFMEYK